MNVPDELRYTKEHEWVSVDEDIVTLGITDHAQAELGDVVYVELPEEGQRFGAEEAFGSVESVKAVSEIYTPVAGEIVAVNEKLSDTPEIVNEDPYGEGWMVQIRLSDPEEVDELMTSEEYSLFVSEESGQ